MSYSSSLILHSFFKEAPKLYKAQEPQKTGSVPGPGRTSTRSGSFPSPHFAFTKTLKLQFASELRNRLWPCVCVCPLLRLDPARPEFPPRAPNPVSEGEGGPAKNCCLGFFLATRHPPLGWKGPTVPAGRQGGCSQPSHGFVVAGREALQRSRAGGSQPCARQQLAKIGLVENSPLRKKKKKSNILETVSALAKP